MYQSEKGDVSPARQGLQITIVQSIQRRHAQILKQRIVLSVQRFQGGVRRVVDGRGPVLKVGEYTFGSRLRLKAQLTLASLANPSAPGRPLAVLACSVSLVTVLKFGHAHYQPSGSHVCCLLYQPASVTRLLSTPLAFVTELH